MTAPTVLGVDPGQTATGLIVRQAGQLHASTTAIRPAGTTRTEWADQILTTILATLNTPHIDIDLVAIEDVATPHIWHQGRKQVLDPTSCIETALIAGAVLGWAWAGPVNIILVEPAHNGQSPRQAYPDSLWGPREGPAGTGRLRHCRSAWDVAGTAALIVQGRRVA